MTEPADVAAGSTTLMPQTATKPPATGGDVDRDRLTPSESAESRIEAWHTHVTENADELHKEVARAREVLQTGTAAEAIELADEDVPQRARAAASGWPTAAS